MAKLTVADIHTRHSYQAPTSAARDLHDFVNRTTEAVALAFNQHLPECRELALVHTHLEEARFWANAAIARNHEALDALPRIGGKDPISLIVVDPLGVLTAKS